MSNKKQYYRQPEIIDIPIGNNAFSFTERQQKGSECIIHIPTIKSISIEDFLQSWDEILGETIVFEEIDEKGNLHSCTGLKHIYQLENKEGKPIYVMDNHNHALYLRTLAYQQKRLGAWASLIHIDQHADIGQPITPIDKTKYGILSNSFLKEWEEYIAQFANEVCNVGSFIMPAQEIGLINEIIQVRSVTKLIQDDLERAKYILDIDIDFFVDHSPTETELQAIKKLYKDSNCCTIALSPYFMDIKKAVETTKKIINSIFAIL